MSGVSGSSASTSYDNIFAQLYVPSSKLTSIALSADTPGAYFRLGGYSDIEDAANTADTLSQFYPRQEITDESSDALANSAGASSGESGILLACNGRLLVRAGEKAYLQSGDTMHVDAVGSMTLHTDADMSVDATGNVSITSGENKGVTISAGDGTGNISWKGLESKKEVFGHDTEVVTEDTYKYFKANSYSYTLGTQNSITLGGKFSLWLGASFSFSLAVDLSVSVLTKINIWMTVKTDIGPWKIDIYAGKTEVKNAKMEWATLNTKAAAAKTEMNDVKLLHEMVTSRLSEIDSSMSTIDARQDIVSSRVGNIFNAVVDLYSYV